MIYSSNRTKLGRNNNIYEAAYDPMVAIQRAIDEDCHIFDESYIEEASIKEIMQNLGEHVSNVIDTIVQQFQKLSQTFGKALDKIKDLPNQKKYADRIKKLSDVCKETDIFISKERGLREPQKDPKYESDSLNWLYKDVDAQIQKASEFVKSYIDDIKSGKTSNAELDDKVSECNSKVEDIFEKISDEIEDSTKGRQGIFFRTDEPAEFKVVGGMIYDAGTTLLAREKTSKQIQANLDKIIARFKDYDKKYDQMISNFSGFRVDTNRDKAIASIAQNYTKKYSNMLKDVSAVELKLDSVLTKDFVEYIKTWDKIMDIALGTGDIKLDTVDFNDFKPETVDFNDFKPEAVDFSK